MPRFFMPRFFMPRFFMPRFFRPGSKHVAPTALRGFPDFPAYSLRFGNDMFNNRFLADTFTRASRRRAKTRPGLAAFPRNP
ncbi:hypothetical protein GE569_33850 [Burkholderia gladioli]